MNHPHGHEHPPTDGRPGRLITWPRRYDLLMHAVLAGRGRRLRARIAQLLDLQPGSRVLDVGCGTGTTTLALAERVGPSGSVLGVDAAPQMVEVAQAKAARVGSTARFQVATAQHLPLPDAGTDAVVTTLMIHHLPTDQRPVAPREMLRVLRPGGRVLVVDYQPPRTALPRAAAMHLLGHPMTSHDLSATAEQLVAAGARDVGSFATPVPWLGALTALKG